MTESNMANERQEHIKEMNEELEKLQNNLYTMSKLSRQTAKQYDFMQQLGLSQASFFMSAHSIFQALNESNEDDDYKGR